MAIPRAITKELSNDELRAAVNRADRIIGWMADHIGHMAPPDGGISDLNDHWLFMQCHGTPAPAPKHRGGRPLNQRPAR